MKLEPVHHKGTYIGSITEYNGLIYAFQAHARPGHPAHYSGTSKADARQWLRYMRDCPVHVGPLDFVVPAPRFPEYAKAA